MSHSSRWARRGSLLSCDDGSLSTEIYAWERQLLPSIVSVAIIIAIHIHDGSLEHSGHKLIRRLWTNQQLGSIAQTHVIIATHIKASFTKLNFGNTPHNELI